MTYAHITIDNDVVLDGIIDPASPTPPGEIVKHLKPGTPDQPGMIAVLLALGAAVKTGRDITAHLTNRDSGYTLAVDVTSINVTLGRPRLAFGPS